MKKVYKRLNGKVVRVRQPKFDSRLELIIEHEVDYPAEVHALPTLGGHYKHLNIKKVGV